MITIEKNNTRETLRAIENPVMPGNRWKPIQHGELVDSVFKSLSNRNIGVLEENWSTSKDQNQLVGTMDLAIPAEFNIDKPDGMNFSLGLLHSNDKTKALRFVTGGTVFVCHNGMVTGDFVVCKKHTLNLDLNSVVDNGIEKYLNSIRNITEEVNSFQESPINDAKAESILVEAGKKKILPWSRIGQTIEEYHKPSFQEFEKRDLWSLYNAFTFVAQKSPAPQQIKAIGDFRHLLVEDLSEIKKMAA